MLLCIAIFATVASATSCLNVSHPMPQSEFSQQEQVKYAWKEKD